MWCKACLWFGVAMAGALGGLWASPAVLSLFGAAPTAARPATPRVETQAMPVDSTPKEFRNQAFALGTRYPPPVTVNLSDTVIAPGARDAFINISLSGPSANTVIAYVRCAWGSGTGPLQDRVQAVFFRPGDPAAASVSCPLKSAESGQYMRFLQADVPDGAAAGVREAKAVIGGGAPTKPIGRAGFRLPYRFAPIGEPVYSAAGTAMKVDDQGGPQTWSTALVHGRTQTGNAETGFYGEFAWGGFERRGGAMVMMTRRLDRAIKHEPDRDPYPFLASALSAHNMPDAMIRYGSIEWTVRMPDRRYSWPALWLLPKQGWPPEIDVYEGFGQNSDWNFDSNLSTNLHGGSNGRRMFTRDLFRLQMGDIGLANDLTKSFHKFQVSVEPGWITMFVDGIETVRYANPFAGELWYPLMTVAVKAPMSADYADGSGAMEIQSVKVWRQD